MFYEMKAAVVGSVEKWRRVSRDGIELGSRDCPLCIMTGLSQQCPVAYMVWCARSTIGNLCRCTQCMGTPYPHWAARPHGRRQERTRRALDELRYLEELFDDLYCIEFMGGVI